MTPNRQIHLLVAAGDNRTLCDRKAKGLDLAFDEFYFVMIPYEQRCQRCHQWLLERRAKRNPNRKEDVG